MVVLAKVEAKHRDKATEKAWPEAALNWAKLHNKDGDATTEAACAEVALKWRRVRARHED